MSSRSAPYALALALVLTAYPSSAQAETIHRRGLLTVTIPFRMNDENPSADGPFGSRFFDLDVPQQLQGYSHAVDVEVNVNARRATFAFGGPPNRRPVNAGPNPPSYRRCVQLLSSAPPGGPAERAPTGYRCVRTSDGRIARFRVLRWRGNYKPDSYVDMIIDIQTRVWNP